MSATYYDVSELVGRRAVLSMGAWNVIARSTPSPYRRAERTIALFMGAAKLDELDTVSFQADEFSVPLVIQRSPALVDDGSVLTVRLEGEAPLMLSAQA